LAVFIHRKQSALRDAFGNRRLIQGEVRAIGLRIGRSILACVFL
jgi:hypothetical protein